MSMTLFWGIIILSLVAHEFGHAYELVKNGGKLKRIGLGLPISRVPYAHITYKGVSIELHPVILGAFVEPVDNGWEDQATPKQKLAFCGGGIMGNILFTILLLFIVMVLKANIYAPLLIAVACMVYLSRNAIYMALPLIGTGLIGVSVYTMMNGDVFTNSSFIHANDLLSSQLGDLPVTTITLAAAVISLVFGIFNAMPIAPLDGFHMVSAVVKDTIKDHLVYKLYAAFGVVIVLTLTLMTVLSTVWDLVNK